MKTKILLLFALLALSVSCAPVAYAPAVRVGLSAVEAASAPGIAASLDVGNPSLSRCAAFVALREGARNAREALATAESTGVWTGGYPALHVEYGDCAPLSADGVYRPVPLGVAGPIIRSVGLPLVHALDVAFIQPAVADAELSPATKAALAALPGYLLGLLDAVLAELPAPDGSLDVPGVPFEVAPAPPPGG